MRLVIRALVTSLFCCVLAVGCGTEQLGSKPTDINKKATNAVHSNTGKGGTKPPMEPPPPPPPPPK
jgi:hypothetical protein